MNLINKLIVSEPVRGFTERDTNSKAILNKDIDSLLTYKIQKLKLIDINKNKETLESIKKEISEMKTNLIEIKSMLLMKNEHRN
jgi:hypothetical protein